MKITELLQESELPKKSHNPFPSKLSSAPSLDDEPDEMDGELDGEEDDEEDDDKKQKAIDAFKDAGTDLGEGIWAIAIYPDYHKNEETKLDAIDGLLKAFPDFNDNVLKSTVEQLFVAVFNEDSEEFESIKATPYEDDRKSSKQFGNLSDGQDESMGTLYKLISRWSRDPDRHNTHKLRTLLR
jgi:hypothetical protein